MMDDWQPPRKKRRGGHQQRLQQHAAEKEAPASCESSALCLLLLNLFAWGFFSPQRVQQIAEMAVKDIERSKEDPQVLKDLYTLSNLGTKGKHANNIHAELMSKVEHVPKIPKPFKAKVPLKGFLTQFNRCCCHMKCLLVYTATTRRSGPLQLCQALSGCKSFGEPCGFIPRCVITP